MAAKFYRNIWRLLPVLFFVGFSLLFYYSSPAAIIGFVGVESSYLLISILALLGGLTTFSGIPYHLILVALAAGGLNPFLLGITTATGVMLGDSTSYYIGYQGATIVSSTLQKNLQRICSFCLKYPKFFPLFFFLYGSLVPFSNDIITIPMGILRYPFWRVITPLGLGNLFFNTSLALLAAYAYEFLQKLPFL